MGYIVDIETDFDPIPFREALGDVFIEFMIGADLDEEQVLIMSVMLIDGGSRLTSAQDSYDFRFGFRWRCVKHTWKVGAPMFDSDSATAYVTPQDRPLILDLVLKAANSLIWSVKPRFITMSTYHTGLPPKAMRKYDRVRDLFIEIGYHLVDAFEDDEGRSHWLFSIERQNPS